VHFRIRGVLVLSTLAMSDTIAQFCPLLIFIVNVGIACNPLKMIIMQNVFSSLLVVSLLFPMVACKSDPAKANETLESAIQFTKSRNEQVPQDSGRFSVQDPARSGEIKKVPSQDELRIKHKVKTVKEIYDSGWSISTYDRNGNLISMETNDFGKKTFTYEFDQNGHVLKEHTKSVNGWTSVREYTYNENGKISSKSYTSSLDGKTEITRYEYDTVLNTRTETSATGTEKEFYDNQGLRVRFESYDEVGKFVAYGDAKYDEDGLKISETASLMGMNTRDECEYNELGQLVKLHRTGIVDVYLLFEHNEKGLMTKSVNVNGTKEYATIYEYTYF
jgi:hypothetical protein